MHEDNFIHKTNKRGQTIYSIINEKLSNEIDRQKNKPFVKHHLRKSDGKFPI